MSINVPDYAHMRTLAELRKRLWLAEGAELSAESRAIYTHIEKTLITTLEEHYGKQKETNKAGNRDHTKEPQRGND